MSMIRGGNGVFVLCEADDGPVLGVYSADSMAAVSTAAADRSPGSSVKWKWGVRGPSAEYDDEGKHDDIAAAAAARTRADDSIVQLLLEECARAGLERQLEPYADSFDDAELDRYIRRREDLWKQLSAIARELGIQDMDVRQTVLDQLCPGSPPADIGAVRRARAIAAAEAAAGVHKAAEPTKRTKYIHFEGYSHCGCGCAEEEQTGPVYLLRELDGGSVVGVFWREADASAAASSCLKPTWVDPWEVSDTATYDFDRGTAAAVVVVPAVVAPAVDDPPVDKPYEASGFDADDHVQRYEDMWPPCGIDDDRDLLDAVTDAPGVSAGADAAPADGDSGDDAGADAVDASDDCSRSESPSSETPAGCAPTQPFVQPSG